MPKKPPPPEFGNRPPICTNPGNSLAYWLLGRRR